MNTSKEHIYSVIGLDPNESVGINLYDKDICIVCGDDDCVNKLISDVSSCLLFNADTPIEDWWTELKKELYIMEIPYTRENGTIDEGTDATSDILKSLKDDDALQSHMIWAWAIGDSPLKAVRDVIEADGF